MPPPVSDPDPVGALADFATLAFLIAFGADADLDAREMDVLTRRIKTLSERLRGAPPSASELADVLQEATRRYYELAIADANILLDRLGRSLDAEQRAEAYGAFVEIAAADDTLHTMEQTFLRHIAVAWHLD